MATRRCQFSVNGFVYVYYTATHTRDPQPREPLHRERRRGRRAGSESRASRLNNLSSATNHNGGAHALRPRRQALHRGRARTLTRSNAQTPRQPASARCCASTRTGPIPGRQPVLRHRRPGRTARSGPLGLRNPVHLRVPARQRAHVHQRRGREHVRGDQRRHQRAPQLRVAQPRGQHGATPRVIARPSLTGTAARAATGCAITGGSVFYDPGDPGLPDRLPSGKLLLADFRSGWIRLFDPAAGTAPSAFCERARSRARWTCGVGEADGSLRAASLESSGTGMDHGRSRSAAGRARWRPRPIRPRIPVSAGQPALVQRVRVGHGAAELPVAARRRRHPRRDRDHLHAPHDDAGRRRRGVHGRGDERGGSATRQRRRPARDVQQPARGHHHCPREPDPLLRGRHLRLHGHGLDPRTACPAAQRVHVADRTLHHDTHTHPFSPRHQRQHGRLLHRSPTRARPRPTSGTAST